MVITPYSELQAAPNYKVGIGNPKLRSNKLEVSKCNFLFFQKISRSVIMLQQKVGS